MRFRSQSAMEYLMTYGWAVLIIAVVLAALVSLGAFNSALWGPRASAGSCKLFRTTAITTLEGVCNNVIPQTAAQLTSGSSSISVSSPSPSLAPTSQVSAFAWIDPAAVYPAYPYSSVSFPCPGIVEYSNGAPSTGYALYLAGDCGGTAGIRGIVEGSGSEISGAISPNTWTFVGLTYNGVDVCVLVNTIPTCAAVSTTMTYASSHFYIGQSTFGDGGFPGSIADVQVYNTSLDANQVQALYMEGIGGVPVNLQYIVGWWPLNGDFNDYSGNGNAGTPTSMAFTSSWTSGYTNP